MKIRLKQLPFLGGFITRMDRDIQEVGLQRAMLKAVHRSGTELEIVGKTNHVERILSHEPVVVVANHPYEAETIALIATLPPRNDAYLIVNYNFKNISVHLDRHLIPVYIKHRIDAEHARNLISKCLKLFHPTPVFSPEEEHQKNIESIEKASEEIRKGGLVIIFPGGRGVNRRWFSGVGHLLKLVGNKNGGYLIKAYISGTSNLDRLRIIPGLGKFFPSIKIIFSKPSEIAGMIEEDAQEITLKLENEYNQWVSNDLDQ